MLNLVIPIDITVLSVLFSVKSVMSEIEMIIYLIVLSLFLVIFLTMTVWRINEEIYFLEDFMLLVFPELGIKVLQDNKKKNN